MIASGEVRAICTGGVEEESDIVENVLSRVFEGPRSERPVRAEGAGALMLTSSGYAAERGLPVLARVLAAIGYRTANGLAAEALPSPTGRSVVLARSAKGAARLLEGTAWAGVEVMPAEVATGVHESAGAIVLASATSLVASGTFDRALVVGESNGNGYVVVLG
jgi:hypothetical protein